MTDDNSSDSKELERLSDRQALKFAKVQVLTDERRMAIHKEYTELEAQNKLDKNSSNLVKDFQGQLDQKEQQSAAQKEADKQKDKTMER